ncbi:MAG: hypothetical protein PWP40_110 [Rhodocyclaceae bacterium]|nr:hypothetical protein [Rhodocyclaceae bacterium]
MTNIVEDPVAATTDAQRAEWMPASDRKQTLENRRLNLIMLTGARGTKNRLAQLAGTSGSRISLMTSARKPVSDPFAFAIEDALGLVRGWLDQRHSEGDVPEPAWRSLRADGAAAPARTPPPERSQPDIGPDVSIQDAATRTTSNRLFDKTAGSCGPIAEALAKTILNLSAADKLSEEKAFQLLGALIAESQRLE